jgi:hypothetical protein
MDTFGAFPLPEKGVAFGLSWEGILCAGEGFCQVSAASGCADLWGFIQENASDRFVNTYF